MGAIDRSERCRGVAHQHEYESQRLRLIVADGTPRYLETVRNLSEFHAIADLLGRAANFEETIQLDSKSSTRLGSDRHRNALSDGGNRGHNHYCSRCPDCWHVQRLHSPARARAYPVGEGVHR